MQLPGFVYSALIVALIAFLQAISTNLESLTDWWAPAVVLLVAGALKALEARQGKAQGNEVGARNIEQPRGFWSRFLLG